MDRCAALYSPAPWCMPLYAQCVWRVWSEGMCSDLPYMQAGTGTGHGTLEQKASRARLGQMGPAAGESGVRMSCRMLLLLQHQRNCVSWPSLAGAEHASQRLHDVMRMLFLRPAC